MAYHDRSRCRLVTMMIHQHIMLILLVTLIRGSVTSLAALILRDLLRSRDLLVVTLLLMIFLALRDGLILLWGRHACFICCQILYKVTRMFLWVHILLSRVLTSRHRKSWRYLLLLILIPAIVASRLLASLRVIIVRLLIPVSIICHCRWRYLL